MRLFSLFQKSYKVPYVRLKLLLHVVEDCDIIQAPQWVTERGGLLIAFFRVNLAVAIIHSKNSII